jgi:hypothetical protein
MKYRALGTLIFLAVFSVFNTAFAQETIKRYLSGTGNDHTVNWDFFCTAGQNSGKWTKIAVPSCWELQGFGKYDYGFAKDSLRGKEKGMYKHQFAVPAAWKGKVINIFFEGSMTDTEVKINGQSAGAIHQGSFYSFKYDISNLLKYGSSNLLEVTVAKHSANTSVNAAERKGDFWLFGGIFRPVFLEVLPAQNMAKVALDAKANGAFKADLYLEKTKGANQVSAQIYNLNGSKVGASFTSKIIANDSVAHLQTTIASPKVWTSEFPNLYNVEFTLLANGKTVHKVSKRFGFRTIEVRERDGIYVNGTKVKLKGVNRHSFWPTSGRTLSKKLSIEDVSLMKEMNMNAVRMSHYPPDDHFLDVCDSLGLFVLDELTGWHGHYDTPTGTKLTRELLAHDQIHPSIIFWINGNEGGHNYDLDHLFDEGDLQHRPLIHAWELFRGIDTQHYREYNYGIGNYMQGHNIVMPTEFLHGMYDGGHGAGLEDYWEAMWHFPLAAGGFLWDYADEGVVRTDKNGEIDTDGNHGADGIIGPYHEKEGSFYTIKEVWAPVKFDHQEITVAFNGNLRLENRFFYTNINQCSFNWKLSKFAGPDGKTKTASVTGSALAPNIKPAEKGTIKLALPVDWKNYDVLYVTGFNPYKKEIFTWSWPISKPEKIAQNLVVKEASGTVTVTEADSLYRVAANGVQLAFNKNSGLLEQVKNGKGIIPFNHGPVLQEGINNFQGFTQKFEGRNLIIESTFNRKTSYNTLQWTIYPSGWVKMKVNYFPSAYFTNIVGANFSYPESKVKGIKYMGSGPYRVWQNRMKGTSLGVWEKAYNNTSTGEKPFVYPEFKGYHANLYWAKLLTSEQPITMVSNDEDVFLRLFTPKFSADPYNTTAEFPTGDISFMQAISGVGTKTQKAETTGPMGEKHIFYDFEKDPKRAKELTIFFDFSGK